MCARVRACVKERVGTRSKQAHIIHGLSDWWLSNISCNFTYILSLLRFTTIFISTFQKYVCGFAWVRCLMATHSHTHTVHSAHTKSHIKMAIWSQAIDSSHRQLDAGILINFCIFFFITCLSDRSTPKTLQMIASMYCGHRWSHIDFAWTWSFGRWFIHLTALAARDMCNLSLISESLSPSSPSHVCVCVLRDCACRSRCKWCHERKFIQMPEFAAHLMRQLKFEVGRKRLIVTA